MVGVIKGTGSYAPRKIVDNHQLAQIVETSDEWIRERTGVERRHIIEDETTTSMAIEAAKVVLESSQVSPEDIGLIIVATVTPNETMPCVACSVQKEIGAVNAAGFDLNAACTGFLYAYNTAQSYIAAGMVKYALIIGSESLSTAVDWSDRGTCILFGDGAGAVVLEAKEGDIPPMVLHSNGEKGQALTCSSAHPYIQMDGQEVFKFAVRQVPNCIEELLDKMNLDREDIDFFILHQANKRIVEAAAKRLKVSVEKFPMNLMEYGNTSSASIPLLLDEWNKTGKLKKGMKIVLSGFGAGLSWGATYLEW